MHPILFFISAGLDNSSYDKSKEVYGECNDEGKKVKLPSQGKEEGTNNDRVDYCVFSAYSLYLNDFSHQSLLQILPTDIKKSFNEDYVMVEEEVTDSKKVLIWIKLSLNRHANMLNSQREHEKQL